MKMTLVCGVGINEKKYPTQIDGKNIKAYGIWLAMVTRCYNKKCQTKNPTYVGCSVSSNFKSFSYFYEWCHEQVGFGLDAYHLDKDVIYRGNKLYSEDTCVFVPREINLFFCDSRAARGEFPIGVSLYKARGNYTAECTVNGKRKSLGYFTSPQEAHAVYKTFKENLCKELATKWRGQIDNRVYDAMMIWDVK